MALNVAQRSRGLGWFVEQAPKGDDGWRRRQVRLGLGTAVQYSETIRDFLDLQPIASTPEGVFQGIFSSEDGEYSKNAIANLTKHFSKCVQRSSANAALTRVRASFQRLLLLSMCIILRASGYTVDHIDDIISWLSPVQRVRQHCLKGIEWVHEAIKALHLRQGWTLERATELFFLVPISISRLGELYSTDLVQFAKSVPPCQDKTCLSPQFTFPALLWDLYKTYGATAEIASLADVSLLIGYPGCAQQDARRVYDVSSPVLDLQIEFCRPENSTLSSYSNFITNSALDNPPDLEESERTRDTKVKYPAATPSSQSSIDTPYRPDCDSVFIDTVSCGQTRHSGPSSSGAPLPAIGHDASSVLSSKSGEIEITQIVAEPVGECDPKLKALLSLFRGPPAFSLPYHQLLRGNLSQKRWDKAGHVSAVSLSEAGFADALTHFFQDQSTLACAIDLCTKQGLLCKLADESGVPVYSLHTSLRCGSEGKEWSFDGLAYICYILPREEALDSNFQLEAAALLPAFHIWFSFLKQGHCSTLPLILRQQLIEACAALPKSEHALDSALTLSILDGLHADDLSDYHRLELVRARSALLRRTGVQHLKESDDVVERVLQLHTERLESTDIRMHCTRKKLQLSVVENAILRQRYETALSILHSIHVPEDQTTWPELEFQVARRRLALLGLVFRYMGKFVEAMQVLDVCSDICQNHEGAVHQYHLFRHRAELLCELGQPEQASALLRKSLLELRQQDSARGLKHYRRLCLAYVEAQYLCKNYDEASTFLDEVEECFERKLPAMPSESELDHVRSRICRMRLAYSTGNLSAASQHATEAIDLIDQYHSLAGRDYYRGITLRLRANVYLQLANVDNNAADLCSTGPQHLVVGMGTYGRDEIFNWLNKSPRPG